jgi:hypoxanthine-DNA glycosylase
MKPVIEIHPFGKFVPPDAKCIVLGSFPTLRKNWRFDSFYPGRSNFFWRMLSEIYNHPFAHKEGEKAARERIELLTAAHIAITDTIYSVQRKVATSSKDSDLIVVKKMNIIEILQQHPTIRTVILTGSSGQVSAHSVFFQHLAENDIPFQVGSGKPPINGEFVLGKRPIKTYSLYSTSGLNIGRYKEAVEQYRKCLPVI